MGGKRFLGIEIGGTKLQLVSGTAEGRIEDRCRFEVIPERGAVGIQTQIETGFAKLLPLGPIHGAGVGFGGPVDWRNGRVFKSHHISGWNGFELGDWLQQRVGVPVFVDNDANVAALAEARVGAGNGKNPVFYMTIGSGVGGGVVHDGKIYHGRFPGEVEIGHIRIPLGDAPEEWPILEDCCSGWALDRQLRDLVAFHPKSPLARQVEGGGKEARYLISALQSGDREVRTLWERWTKHLALGLSHVVHMFHPEILILGGGVSLMGDSLLREVRVQLSKCVMNAYEGTYVVELAGCGEDVVPVGALILAAEGLNRV